MDKSLFVFIFFLHAVKLAFENQSMKQQEVLQHDEVVLLSLGK